MKEASYMQTPDSTQIFKRMTYGAVGESFRSSKPKAQKQRLLPPSPAPERGRLSRCQNDSGVPTGLARCTPLVALARLADVWSSVLTVQPAGTCHVVYCIERWFELRQPAHFKPQQRSQQQPLRQRKRLTRSGPRSSAQRHRTLAADAQSSPETLTRVLRFLSSPGSKSSSHSKFTMASNVSQCLVWEEMEPFTYFYYLIFLMGFIGSCFALWAFTQKDQKQKPMSIYLMNLLTADFLLTLALPVKIIVDLGVASWELRIFHCQVTACFIYLNMYLSIIFLGFVSMDRCLQLMHSCKIYRIQEPGFAKMLSAVVWTMVLLITVPNMAIPIKTIEERPGAGCIDFKSKFGRDWHVLTNFICTAIFLNFSAVILISNFLVVRQLYRNKDSESHGSARRALLSILLLSAGYLLCFVPYHAVRIPYTLSQSDAITSCALKRALFKAKESTLLFAVSSLCFDPILYYCLSKSFRLKFTGAFAARQEEKVSTATGARHSSQEQNPTCAL